MPAHTCPLCSEPIAPGDDALAMSGGHARAHRECLLRAAVGGIGHFEDHQRWCVGRGDPDGGRSYRQSAIEVDEWYAALS